MFNKFKIKLKSLMHGYPVIKVSNEVMMYYRDNVAAGNMDSYLIKRKLSRNYYSGITIFNCGNVIVKAYGNLDIYIDTNNKEIFKIHNNKGVSMNRPINHKMKNKLNKLFEIKDIKSCCTV